MKTTTQPIRNEATLQEYKNYYKNVEPNLRNYTMIILSLNTALRISDILARKWQDFLNHDNSIRSHLELIEKKTGKSSTIAINSSLKEALSKYMDHSFSGKAPNPDAFLFPSSQKGKHLSRIQAYRVMKKAACACGLPAHVSCHSMRKTFGYHAWKQGVKPAMLMDIYNHSSYSITRRYLGIDQNDRDEVFQNIVL